MSKKKDDSSEMQVEKITTIMMQEQNKNLYNKAQFQSNTIKKLNDNIEIMELAQKNYESLFTTFFSAWKVFMLKLQSIHQIIKQSGESKLQPQFQSVFEIIPDIFGIFEQVKDQKEQNFQSEIKSKIDTFVKAFEQIYIRVMIDYNGSQDRLSKLFDKLTNQMDIKDCQTQIIKETLETRKKNKEYQDQIKDKSSQYDFQKLLEQDLIHDKIKEVKSQLQKQEEINYTLLRRLKIQQNYNSVSKNIEDLLASNQGEQFISEKYQCVCGILSIEDIQQDEIKKIKEIESMIRSGKFKGVNKDVMEIEQECDKNEGPDQNQYNLTEKEQHEVLKKQFGKLEQQKLYLEKENKKNQLNQKNIEEYVFNSEIFKKLVSQGQDLMKYCQTLKQQLISSKQNALESEKLRQKEVQELISKHKEEKLNIQSNILKGFTDQQKKYMTENLKEILKEYDVSDFKKKLQQRVDEQQQTVEQQKEQIIRQGKMLQDYQTSKNQFSLKIDEQMVQIQKLTQDNMAYQNQFKDQKAEQSQFKYSKHKQLFVDIEQKLGTTMPGLSKRINDLIYYIKSFEKKGQQWEEKVSKQKGEIEKDKKTIDGLYNEIDTTSDGFEKLQEQNKNLSKEMQSKEETESNLNYEKMKEKLNFDQEKQTYAIKIQTCEEIINQQRLQIKEIQVNQSVLNDKITEQQKTIDDQQKSVLESKEQLSQLQSLSSQKDQELFMLKKSQEEGTIINTNTIEEKEKLEQALKKQQLILDEKIKSFNKSGENEITMQLDYYKSKVVCNNCNERDKEVILSKCQHLFCKECIENNIRVRNRACPTCRKRFDQTDIKDIFW